MSHILSFKASEQNHMYFTECFKLSLEILDNLSKVPRFQTIAMFLDKQEKSGKVGSSEIGWCCSNGCLPVQNFLRCSKLWKVLQIQQI